MASPDRNHEKRLLARDHYRYFTRITTRWIDNDVYGHINNVNYYQFFDTAVNEFLIAQTGLNFLSDEIVAFVVASSCQYRSPLSHPAIIHAGLCVNHLGNSSVEYGVAIFADEGADEGADESAQAAAFGTFTHVYVNRAAGSEQGSAVAIPLQARAALEKLVIPL